MFKLQFPDPMEENNNSDRCKEDDALLPKRLVKPQKNLVCHFKLISCLINFIGLI